MELSIIENAMDSLNEAIDYYHNGIKYDDERCYKFCILLLSHSAELCLKEVLLRQHKAFLYENIDEIKDGEEQATVGFRLALKRVNKICGIDLGPYNSYLERLAQTRNNIQHYKVSVSSENCLSTITSSFSAIEHIVHNVLKMRFDDFEDVISYDQIESLRKDTRSFAKRKQDISKEINDNSLKRVGLEYRESKVLYIPCPRCHEKYLVYGDNETVICKLCNERFETLSNVFESDYDCVISAEMKREIGRRRDCFTEIYECEKCNNDTLVYCINKNDDPNGVYSHEKWICFSCGNIVASESCSDCEAAMPYSEYNYTFAQSYTNTDDYMFLCRQCGEKLKNSEHGVCYDIS